MTNDYDVFLSHNGADEAAVEEIAARLRDEERLRPFLDKWHLVPGESWIPALERALEQSTTVAVFFGPAGVGTWHDEEKQVALDLAGRARQSGRRVIPVLLPGGRREDIEGFLRLRTWVDLAGRNGFARLVAGIRGRPLEGPAVGFVKEPFVGLRAIDEEDSDLFFGREDETQEFVDKLRRTPLVMVVGDSGSGKSSLVLAGLVPQFRKGALVVDREWVAGEFRHVIKMSPRGAPRKQLGEAVYEAGKTLDLSDERRRTFAKWASSGDADDVRLALRCDLPREHTQVLLVVDQFEELWTSSPREERKAFVDLLLELVTSGEGLLFVVLTMRRDYANLCNELEPLKVRLEREGARARYDLRRISNTGLRRVVTEPLKLAGVGTQQREALADIVLGDIGERPGDLALVQMALSEAWNARQDHGNDLLRAYASVGRVEGALAKAADAVRNRLDDYAQAHLDAILVRLVQLGDTGGAIRRLATRSEFEDARWSVVQHLASKTGKRLVLLGGKEGCPTAEMAHEALVTAWPHFQTLLQGCAEDKRVLDAIVPRAKAWAATDDTEGKLLATGIDLEAFERLSNARTSWLSQPEIKFISASAKAATRRRLQEIRKTRVLLASMVVGLAATIVAGITLQQRASRETKLNIELKEENRQKQKALTDRETALEVSESNLRRSESLRLATVSSTLAEQYYALGSLLAVEAVLMVSEHEERVEALTLDNLRQFATQGLLLGRHGDYIQKAVFSPDGQHVVTASNDGTARVWEVNSGESIELYGHRGSINTAAFSPDGKLIVTSSWDGTARIWQTDGSMAPVVLYGHQDIVNMAMFSNDGDHVVTASRDGTARVWLTVNGAESVVLSGHSSSINTAAFSPDATLVVTASHDGTARIWKIDETADPIILRGHNGSVNTAEFSPDGAFVVTSSDDKTARVWQSNGDGKAVSLNGHEDGVETAAFSPDGMRVVTASTDGTARLWPASGNGESIVLRGHDYWVYSAKFSPDGKFVVTASADATARLWRIDGGNATVALRGHLGQVFSAEFSPKGDLVVTASDDSTARLWPVGEGNGTIVLRGHGDTINSAEFSPDGNLVATSSEDGTARVWQGPDSYAVLSGHGGPVNVASFSPDSTLIVTASNDKTARLWRTGDNDLRAILRGHTSFVGVASFSPNGEFVLTSAPDGTRIWRTDGTTEPIFFVHGSNAARFSPDGTMVASFSSWGNTVNIWKMDGTGEPVVLRDHESSITSVVFSPNGMFVATTSLDGPARVWRTDGTGDSLTLSGHEADVNTVAFSPDSTLAITASDDGTARLWKVGRSGDSVILRGHADVVNMAQFSADGRLVVTASDDATARVWTIDGRDHAVLRGHEHGVSTAAFSPDSGFVITASPDDTARVWIVDPVALVPGICRGIGRNLTSEEWATYIPDRPYRETCAPYLR